MVRQLITAPNRFFDRKVGQAHLRFELVVVILVGALSLPGIIYLGLEILEASRTAEMRFTVTGRVVRPVFIMLVLWVVYTLFFHFFSLLYRGRGSPSRVLKGVAWAFLPIGLGNLVKSVGLFLALRDENFDDLLDGLSTAEQAQSVFDAAMTDPLMIGAMVIMAATILWSGYLMVFVVEHAKGVSHEEARRVVAVPVVLHVLAIVWAIVRSSTNFATVL